MITFLYAGILGLLYVALAFYTIAGRFKHRILLGDQGNDDMLARVRVHANFSEYIPLVLVLMMLYEQITNANIMFLHIAGLSLIISRIVFSLTLLNLIKIPFGRQFGMLTTLLVVITFSVLGIYAYFA